MRNLDFQVDESPEEKWLSMQTSAQKSSFGIDSLLIHTTFQALFSAAVGILIRSLVLRKLFLINFEQR